MVTDSGVRAHCAALALARGGTSRWITSTPTAPVRQPATSANWKRSARRSASDSADQRHQIADRSRLGAAGVHEAQFTALMMDNRFIAASANIETFLTRR